MLSFTLATEPENLKNMVGNSSQTRGAVEPALLTTFTITSSMSSMAATGIPDLMTLAAVAAASAIVGNVTTATLTC